MTLVGCDHGHESCARCIAKLTRLEIENERLRAALREIADMKRRSVNVKCGTNCRASYEWCEMTARAALDKMEGGGE